jgi:uncharacterized lipoprotein YajG
MLRFITSIALICAFQLGYAQNNEITIESVTNDIALGDLAGNRQLEFGVKNILEEVLQEYGYDLVPDSNKKLKVSLLYFDVKKTSTQAAIFNKTSDVTEIIASAQIIDNGKESKKVVAKGEATSISTATLIIDKGGKFSQTNVSTALKKVCEELIIKLKI